MIYALIVSAAMMQGQTQVPTPEQNQSYVQQINHLEAMLAEDDYEVISNEIKSLDNFIDASATLNWLGSKFKQGESVFIAWQYSRLLDGFAQSSQNAGMRGTALAAMLYTVAASSVEALQCADRTAWADRAQTFAMMLAQSELLSLSEDERKKAAWVALKIERSNWERRKYLNDAEFLCMNGMAAMSAGIARGEVREAEPEPGRSGRQMKVDPPGDFVYERRENEEWWVDAEQRRQALPTLIAQLANIESFPTDAEMAVIMAPPWRE